MAKAKKKKSPKVPTYEYKAEVMATPAATIDEKAIEARLNELGRQGWKLVSFSGTIAWFVR